MMLHAVIEQDDETLYSYNPLHYKHKKISPFKTVFVANVLCGFCAKKTSSPRSPQGAGVWVEKWEGMKLFGKDGRSD